MRETSEPELRTIDVPGAAAATVGLIRTSQHSWGSDVTVTLIGLGVGLLAAFVLVERRRAEPLVPLRLRADHQGPELGAAGERKAAHAG